MSIHRKPTIQIRKAVRILCDRNDGPGVVQELAVLVKTYHPNPKGRKVAAHE